MSKQAGRLRAAPDFVAFYARTQPDRLAVGDLASGERWSYRALHDAIDRCAAALRDGRGLKAGDRVAVLAKNSGALVILYLASMRAGLIFVPLNWRLTAAELAVLAEDCTPSLLVHDDAHAAVSGALDVTRLSLDALMTAARQSQPAAMPLPAADLPSVLLYTSGTSGKPKGVIITGEGIFHSANNFAVMGRVSHESVFLCESPLFHVIGLLAALRVPLMYGGTVFMSDGFEPARTIARIADPDLAVTHYFCVPQMATSLRNDPSFDPAKLRGLTALYTGGAPNPAANIHWWLDHGITMVDGFGMTETGSTFSNSLEPDVIRRKAGSIGLPAPTVLMKIVDDDGREVGAGATGELWLKGPNVTPGYWNRPEENAKTFTEDGWFRTGDLVSMDEDGFVSIVGRKKDMFISGGENVYPGEVEAALHEHPAVGEVAVVGVPNERWGETGCAYLVARPGAQRANEAELAAFCDARLARYKIPKRFVWLDALPRTASGKTQKTVLRERRGS
jgi:fatty-acyl-CoA synthase